MRDLVFTIIFFVSTAFSIGRPWLGILIWTCLDYMNPHRFCYSFAKYTIPFSMISAIVSLICLFVVPERRRFPLTREVVLLILFILWMSFTSLFALNDGVWLEWNRVIKIQMLIFATLFIMGEPERIHYLTWMIVVSIGLYGVKGGLWTIMTGGASRVRGPADSMIEDNNDIALVLVVILPLMRYLQLRTDKAWVKTGLGIAMGLSSLAAVASYSRAGMLALVTVAICMLIKSRKRMFFGMFLVGSLVSIGLFMPQQWFDRMHTIQHYDEDGSARGRLNAWHFAWNVAKDRPLTGGGYRCFTPKFFRQYAPDPDDYHEAHSIFFKVLAEHGFPGLIMFLTMSLWTWSSATWVRRHAEFVGMAWLGDLNSMIQVSLAGYAVGGAFSNLAYFGLPYHLMVIVVLSKVLVRDAIVAQESGELELETGGVPALAAGT